MNQLSSFIADIFAALTPDLALAGAPPVPHRQEDKPSLWSYFSGNSNANSAASSVPPPPPPPSAAISAAPMPPKPPAPATASSADISAAQQQGAQQAGQGFGYQGSLLRPSKGAVSGATGPNGTVNSATGTGSLLGK